MRLRFDKNVTVGIGKKRYSFRAGVREIEDGIARDLVKAGVAREVPESPVLDEPEKGGEGGDLGAALDKAVEGSTKKKKG